MIRMRQVLLLPVAALIVGTAPLLSAQTRGAATEASLIAAEDAIFTAKVAHDSASIDRAMADEASYTHGSGRVQTKAEYLKALAGNRAPYRSIEPVDRVARVSGDLGITHATLRMTVGERRMEDSYLAAYVRRAGRWQLLYWQTTPLFGATPPVPAPQATPPR